MSEYGAEAWKMHNSVLQQMVEGAQKQLVELRQVFGGLKQAEHLHFVAAYDKSWISFKTISILIQQFLLMLNIIQISMLFNNQYS